MARKSSKPILKKRATRATVSAAVKKTGRPRSEINWIEFDKLCEIQCNQEEIALWFRCSVDTINRACRRDKGVGFAEYAEQKRALGKVSLRRAQFRKALEGNPALLIFLGKNWLGQTDRAELTGAGGASLVPGSIIFTMPKNGRDQGSAEAKPPVQSPTVPAAKPVPGEAPSAEPAAAPPVVAPSLPETPPPAAPPPSLTPAQIAGTAEVDDSTPRPRYSHGGRDPRVAENIHSLKPIGPAGGPAASTGKR